jgi:hypothetical protein
MHGGQIGRRLGKFAAEPGPHLVRNRLPDGTFADVFDVIENVVQHPVRLGPKSGQSEGSSVWPAALDPADCLEFIPGKLAQTFLERAGGDTSAPNRKEIRFVRIYLAGCAAVLCAAAASGHAVALLCWYIPAVIVQLMSVELLNLPHHAEAPPLPARGRSPSLLGP